MYSGKKINSPIEERFLLSEIRSRKDTETKVFVKPQQKAIQKGDKAQSKKKLNYQLEVSPITQESSFLSFYWKGWQWGYAIMRIRDTNGDVKLRLAKCKKHHGFPKTIMHEWDRIDESEIENLSQVNHVNFKTVEELKACYLRLLEEFQEV